MLLRIKNELVIILQRWNPLSVAITFFMLSREEEKDSCVCV